MIDNETRLKNAWYQSDGKSNLCSSTDAEIFTKERRSCMGMTGMAEETNVVEKKSYHKGYAAGHLKGDALKKYDLEVENREVIEAYDRWLFAPNAVEKEEAYTAYTSLLWEKLKFLIKDHIQMHHFNYNKELFEDLMSSGKVAIFEKVATYDPRQSMPASYFGPKIDELLKKCNHSDTHLTDHYLSMAAVLNKAAREAGFADCMDPELTPVVLHLISGVSLKTVVNTLNQLSINHQSIDDEHSKQISGFTTSPEEDFIKSENEKFLLDAVNSLSKYEQFIFFKSSVDVEQDSKGKERHWSTRRICKYLSDPEILEHFGLTKAPDNNKVARDIEIARKKLMHYGNMRERFSYKPKKKTTAYEDYEQAGMDELEEAILSDIQTL